MPVNNSTIRDILLKRTLADLVVSVKASTARVKDRFQRTTQRERLLIGVLILGGSFYAPVQALDYLNRASEGYVDALSQQSTARLAAQAARRITASASDQLALEDMRSWGFSAPNAAVAQLAIEQRLVATVEKAGLSDSVISTQSQIVSHGATHWMNAEVQSDLRWDPFFAMLDTLGEWPEGFQVTGFRYEVLPTRRSSSARSVEPTESGKLYLDLAFPVRLEQMPEDAGPVQGRRS